ncbi:hypothetical protein CsSME_00033090 [Camellia sinensis var. sinensis]
MTPHSPPSSASSAPAPTSTTSTSPPATAMVSLSATPVTPSSPIQPLLLLLLFDVYEIERYYSGCFVKYQVDLGSIGDAFPQMMQRLSWNPMYYSFAILSLVREKKDDDSFMVLHVPGKILRNNLGDKGFEKICDVGAEHCDGNGMIEDSFMYFWFHSFQYIESVSCI